MQRIRMDLDRYIQRAGHGSVTALAESSGLTRQTITAFKRTGKAKPETLKALSAALGKARDHMPDREEDQGKDIGRVSARARVLAQELRALADFLDSDFSNELKRERFTALVRGYHNGIEKIIEGLKEGDTRQ